MKTKLNLKSSDKKSRLKLFMYLTISIVITVIVLSSVLYMFFESTMSDQMYVENVKSLNQLGSQVSFLANTALVISNQIYNDIAVSKLLTYTNVDIYDLTSALSQLSNYRLSLPLIDSIYVYNEKTGAMYVESGTGHFMGENTENFADTDVLELFDNYDKYKPYIPITRKYINRYDKSIDKFYYTFLMYSIVDKNNAVAVNMNEKWINNVINSEPDIAGSYTFIMDSRGYIVSNSEEYPMMSDFSDKDYIKYILKHQDSPGYFVDKVNGVKSLMVYTKLDSYGWCYVRIIPWDTMFSKIRSIRDITIFSSLVILLISIVISFIISARLYSPIEKIINKLELLENEKRMNISARKQEFLTDMALGRAPASETHTHQKYDKLGINIKIDSRVCGLLMRIDHYSSFVQNNNIEDRNLYKFSIINIASEILSEYGMTEAIDMGNDIVFMILDVSELETDSLTEKLAVLLKKIQAAMFEYFKISLSITVSNIGEGMESLHQLYHQTLEYSQYRLYYGYSCMIFEQNMTLLSASNYTYPIPKEKLLISALMACKMNEARKIFDEIVGRTFYYPIIVFNLTISHLLFTINNAINTIKNNTLMEDSDISIPIMLLKQAETVEEINCAFYELLQRVEELLDDKKKSKYDEVVNKVNQIISSGFHRQDLSIESIAETLGMSTAYICRIYKQNTLNTILDEIVKTRMQKARELLQNTDLSVAEVAERIGFSNSSYFYKAFKTANGVTPIEYRKNFRSNF